jgi:hypothetical protein
MKRSMLLILVLVTLAVLSLPGSVLAQGGSPTWNSVIYYYNPLGGVDDGNIQAIFYGSEGTPPLTQTKVVPPHGFGSFLIGSTGDYKGAAALSSDVPLVAVYKQYDASASGYAPTLYTSFDASAAGSNGFFYVPTVMRSMSYVSKVGIQNLEEVPVTLTLGFYNGSSTPKTTKTVDLGSGSSSSYVFSLTDTDIPGIGSSFNGALVIKAVKSGSSDPAKVVAAVEEIQSSGRRSYAFEGSGTPANIAYMPSAMCNFGTGKQTSNYYVQNATAGDITPRDVSVTVRYYSNAGKLLATHLVGTVRPGSKASISTCDPKVYTRMLGKSGNAVISSNGKIAVVGKISSTDGLATAFLGQSQGKAIVLLPYVEWSASTSKPRTSINVMNVGSTQAQSITVRFYYMNSIGDFVYQDVPLATATNPLARYGKTSTYPRVSGEALNSNGNYLGAAEVYSDVPVTVLVRLTENVSGVPGISILGEDYMGIPYTP